MISASSQANDKASRLVLALSDLAIGNGEISHKHFTDRLGQLIDLSDAFTLSETLRGLAKTPFHCQTTPNDTINETFLNTHTAMIESIIKSFIPSATVSIKLPILTDDRSLSDPEAFEPFQRFYTTHQSEMDFHVLKLRTHVRQAVSGYSATLAQLAALDSALGDMLANHTRKLFTVIPRLLFTRFKYLRREYSDRQHNESWLEIFYQEMQNLLLAELDVRIQPIVGLIEAFNEEVERNK